MFRQLARQLKFFCTDNTVDVNPSVTFIHESLLHHHLQPCKLKVLYVLVGPEKNSMVILFLLISFNHKFICVSFYILILWLPFNKLWSFWFASTLWNVGMEHCRSMKDSNGHSTFHYLKWLVKRSSKTMNSCTKNKTIHGNNLNILTLFIHGGRLNESAFVRKLPKIPIDVSTILTDCVPGQLDGRIGCNISSEWYCKICWNKSVLRTGATVIPLIWG